MNEFTNTLLQERYYTEQLANGLTICLLPRPNYTKTYATLTTGYGSVDRHFSLPHEEILAPHGVAHFLEHKMFEDPNEDVFQKFAHQGASINAITSYQQTSYLMSCTHQVENNLHHLLDFVQQLYITDENIDKEKPIIEQEINMYHDHPIWRAYAGLLSAMYHRHPVRIDIAGTSESISHINKSLLRTCYETFYHPSQLLLFVVGPIDPEETIEHIRRNQALKTFPTRPNVERKPVEEPIHPSRPITDISLPTGNNICYFGFKEARVDAMGDDYLKQELCTQLALQALFGKGSWLYNSLHNEGLLDVDFKAEYCLAQGFGFSFMHGTTSDPDTLLQRVQAELPRLLNEGIHLAEWELLRKEKMGEILTSFNSLEWIAKQFTRYYLNRADLFRLSTILSHLTLHDVQQSLYEHMDMEHFCASIVRAS
ncbi:EF-P 5-aminopentanol modification-associated protein YfmH [Mechercharimyces sp. CAU 1602]|uniref:EF-P 5-aminopentanol modification-associated protein YfmH n=1 Tax=Mechercharimyces sp. CAU 1602 TaxID=2973933 RepID=UPI0021639A22|nr:pitrilysin family protein [Mechercharimyces sp. CAU 1602]MCS1350382.1 insulinase family protein [Mechercharimyces sp. CAU 1602]